MDRKRLLIWHMAEERLCLQILTKTVFLYPWIRLMTIKCGSLFTPITKLMTIFYDAVATVEEVQTSAEKIDDLPCMLCTLGVCLWS